MKKNPVTTHDALGSSPDTIHRNDWPEHHHISPDDKPQDHFIVRDGTCFAGLHLLLDFWGAKNLDNPGRIESALRECVERCRATLLHIHLHHFSTGGGISGVAVLAESHISVHTWPERGFAAFDIFMCGQARAEEAIAVLMRAFSPKSVHITKNLRGMTDYARVR